MAEAKTATLTPAPAPSPPNCAGQWGMAALVFGAVVIMSFPMLMILALGESRQIHMNAPKENIELAIQGGYLTAYCIMAMAGCGLTFGLAGLIGGIRRGQPLGLAVAGTVLCIPAAALAVLLYLAVGRIGEDLQRLKTLRKVGSGDSVPAKVAWVSIPLLTALQPTTSPVG
jgi:hypothetical protein